MKQTVAALGRSLVVGAVGGAVFYSLGLPLAWMLGPLLANLIVSVRGGDPGIPPGLRGFALGVFGLVLGSQVTPQLAQRLSDWPVSAALLLMGVALATAAAAAWYRRCGFDSVSAWFASAPGAMTAMIMLGEQFGGDPRRIAIAQSLRIVLVVLFVPPLFWAFKEDVVRVAGGLDQGFDNVWMLLLLPLLFWLGQRIKIPNTHLLTPMLFAGVLSGLDIASLQLAEWGFNFMLWILGCAIGSSFRGLSLSTLKRYLGEAGVATLLAFVILAMFAELIHQLVGVPRTVALLALAPGGVGEMAIVAIALDIDPVFVAFHHLLRMVALMVFAPFWGRWLMRRLAR